MNALLFQTQIYNRGKKKCAQLQVYCLNQNNPQLHISHHSKGNMLTLTPVKGHKHYDPVNHDFVTNCVSNLRRSLTVLIWAAQSHKKMAGCLRTAGGYYWGLCTDCSFTFQTLSITARDLMFSLSQQSYFSLANSAAAILSHLMQYSQHGYHKVLLSSVSLTGFASMLCQYHTHSGCRYSWFYMARTLMESILSPLYYRLLWNYIYLAISLIQYALLMHMQAPVYCCGVFSNMEPRLHAEV